MADIDFMELASYCQNEYKENNTSDKRQYINTLFVAITEGDEVITSATPHILKKAEQCILLHLSIESTSRGRFSDHQLQFIDKDGVVHNNCFDNRFYFYTAYSSNVSLGLAYDDNGIKKYLYKHPAPWESSVEKVWKLYSRVKDLDSLAKIQLVAELFEKDEKILELEKQIEDFRFTKYLLEQERNQYKGLLDEIQQLIDNK